MSYYFAKTLDVGFEDAVARTRAALAEEGFGVITEIDIRQTLKAKLGVEFRPYVILGACNPKMAYVALQAEDKIGAMLPCNVVVQDAGGGRTEVAAIDPVASMQAIANPDLTAKAREVADGLKRAIDSL
jgi:uncharacterized protein (DUF302 family)